MTNAEVRQKKHAWYVERGKAQRQDRADDVNTLRREHYHLNREKMRRQAKARMARYRIKKKLGQLNTEMEEAPQNVCHGDPKRIKQHADA